MKNSGRHEMKPITSRFILFNSPGLQNLRIAAVSMKSRLLFRRNSISNVNKMSNDSQICGSRGGNDHQTICRSATNLRAFKGTLFTILMALSRT